MKDCFVKKLIPIVGDQKLKKIGVVRLPIAPTSTATATYVKHYAGLDPCVVTVYFADGTVYKTFNSSPSDSNTQYVYIHLPDGGYAEISNKYNLYATSDHYGSVNKLAGADLNIFPSVSEFVYCEHLAEINTRDYMVNYAKLSNNLEMIGGGAFQLGDVLDYVIAMRAKGVTSKIVRFRFQNNTSPYVPTTVTFNGTSVSSGTYTTNSEKYDAISWDADKIFIRGANGTRYYTYGYTDEQIAALTATGGDWEGATVFKVD